MKVDSGVLIKPRMICNSCLMEATAAVSVGTLSSDAATVGAATNDVTAGVDGFGALAGLAWDLTKDTGKLKSC